MQNLEIKPTTKPREASIFRQRYVVLTVTIKLFFNTETHSLTVGQTDIEDYQSKICDPKKLRGGAYQDKEKLL